MRISEKTNGKFWLNIFGDGERVHNLKHIRQKRKKLQLQKNIINFFSNLGPRTLQIHDSSESHAGIIRVEATTPHGNINSGPNTRNKAQDH